MTNNDNGAQIDVNPQLLLMNAVQAVVNTYIEASYATGVMANYTKTRALVLEIFKAYVSRSAGGMTNGAISSVYLTSRSFGASAPAWGARGTLLVSSHTSYVEGSSGAHNVITTQEFDFTDGGGKGMLIGVNHLFIGIASVSQSAVLPAEIRLLYRMKIVPDKEYVGILNQALAQT